jgi:hypothetical protein
LNSIFKPGAFDGFAFSFTFNRAPGLRVRIFFSQFYLGKTLFSYGCRPAAAVFWLGGRLSELFSICLSSGELRWGILTSC